MEPEAVVRFEHAGDILPAVQGWAAQEGFRYTGVVDGYATFQKGTGLLVAPMMFAFRQDGARVEARAWVRVNLFARLMSLFMLPASMTVESGGFRGALPRKIGRNAVNRLLERLGQRPIP
jgi:hypothetical protein